MEELELGSLLASLRDSLYGVFSVATKILPDSGSTDGINKDDPQRAILLAELGQKLEVFEAVCDDICSLLDYNKNICNARQGFLENETVANQVEQSRNMVSEFKMELDSLFPKFEQ
eukprot:TRINITY_DN1383_c0_g1_i1.p1 TRINITY_DN1383_c0_g1~~TRINITY_DN1383_c0_g1_i1.p1  ORF type:complete len:116 (-),score=27.38 TRINITY_DN1383_c0_g1_i1:18-365(-)